jgi:hypothetical protein
MVAERISAKSESSPCIQNTGTHGAPMRDAVSAAMPTAAAVLCSE